MSTAAEAAVGSGHRGDRMTSHWGDCLLAAHTSATVTPVIWYVLQERTISSRERVQEHTGAVVRVSTKVGSCFI